MGLTIENSFPDLQRIEKYKKEEFIIIKPVLTFYWLVKLRSQDLYF